MKILLDSDCCAGHGACVVTCPEVFAIGDSGYAELLVDEVPAEMVGLVRRAAAECPTHAISMEE